MNADVINPFIQAVAELFESMLECEVKMGSPGLANMEKGAVDMIGVIGLSGTAQGVVALKLPVKTALAVVGKMVGMKFKSVDSSIIDGVGELVNIIAGSAKAKFKGHKITLSLPTVVRGSICTLSNLGNAVFLEVPFETNLGDFTLLLTFKSGINAKREAEHAGANSR